MNKNKKYMIIGIITAIIALLDVFMIIDQAKIGRFNVFAIVGLAAMIIVMYLMYREHQKDKQ